MKYPENLVRHLKKYDMSPRPMTIFMKEYFKFESIVGCEIGVDNGKHSLIMLENLNIKKLYQIDPYQPYKDYRKGKLVLIDEETQNKKKKLRDKRFKNYDNVYLMQGDSLEYHHIFGNNFFDFVYIDGNHSKKYIHADLNNFYTKVKDGGIIGGHDFSGTHVDVVREVLKFEKKHKLVLHSSDLDWWFIKR